MNNDFNQIYNLDDLVLKVNQYYDNSKYNLEVWDDFLNVLTEGRTYQKEAILSAIYYLIDDNISNLKALAYNNFINNQNLNNKYNNNFSEFESDLQLPYKKYATLDLATGTGKSYVLYGIAQILLGLGFIERVLILCPSTTIEYELTKKFRELTQNKILSDLIPDDAIVKTPRVIDANVSVRPGDICIENIHSVYENTGSSIDDSFKNSGSNTLVLNDEAHHIFNNAKYSGKNETSEIKKWKGFLLNETYNFQYMIGTTGTAYIENEYFCDVIYRYSLNKAIEDRIVKNINYVLKDDEISENEKFTKIYKNHCDYKKLYSKIKPITIFVTKDKQNCNSVANKLKEYLIKFENITEEEANRKVLVVTSAPEHKSNVAILRNVDNTDNDVEWIVSVSMLTEGWDVKNVFQIVPWEDRAFNSKLLISQVLGRGLRIPVEYQSPQPVVTIFNHASWTRNIKSLVDQVLEISDRITSNIIEEGKRSIYNFDLYNINYEKVLVEKEHRKNKIFNYSKMQNEGIKLESQVLKYNKIVEFTDVLENKIIEKQFEISEDTYSVDEVVDKIYDEFQLREWEGITLKLGAEKYTKNNLPPRDEIKKIVLNSMKKVGIDGELLTVKNRNSILKAFNTLLRQNGKTVEYVNIEKDLEVIKTNSMPSQSTNILNLRGETTVFHSNEWKNELDSKNILVFEKILEDETLPRQSTYEINVNNFKTPVDVVIVNGSPERKFVAKLFENNNSSKIDSWIKSRDKNFYSIDYTWRKNGHQKSNSSFNPDFFIKLKENNTDIIVVVVEIKDDGDDCEENKAKYRYALEHFDNLNYKLEKNGINQKYIFHFLSPVSYNAFFEYLNNHKIEQFKCDLENLLEEN